MHLYKVFEIIGSSYKYWNHKKYELGKGIVKCLVRRIINGTVPVDPFKTEAVTTWLATTYIKELLKSLGLANY